MIPLERHSQLIGILGDESSQRNGQIKSHRDIVLPMIEAKHLAISFFAAFTAEDFGILQRRSINWNESVRAINLLRGFDQSLSRNHDLR